MRIFYGVQGTGNGHITRARIMAAELYKAGIDVTFQFTGRAKEQFFDMEIFRQFQWRKGLTFNTRNGQVNYIRTALQASPIEFIKDVCSLDFSSYDLIISDFEPVTAWAAKRQKKTLLGIGHQYAFNHCIPTAGTDPIARQVMKYFAPVDIGIGLHWHHFDQPILPPIIETPEVPKNIQRNKMVVYLPFENQQSIIELLASFKEFEFHLYSPVRAHSKYEHIFVKPLSREGFKKDLYDCAGIISNAGFELASESLQLGKKILAKPLHSQMEQISNARALQQLSYGHTVKTLDDRSIEKWLYNGNAVRITYPNVARLIVRWITEGMPLIEKSWTDSIWKSVAVLPVEY